MSILSLTFLAFLIVLLAAYYLLPKSFSPYVILAGNIYFYLQFGVEHSFWLLLSVVCTYLGAFLLDRVKTRKLKKVFLAVTLVLNLGFLFFVKFVPYILGLITRIVAFDPSNVVNSIVVPVGVSFYTLQLCGYCIDVYRGKYAAERNFFRYTAFATFFPLMLQGPISRYDQLAPTLFQERVRTDFYKNLTSGAKLMLWGFFKKLVIADRAALLVNTVFDNYTSYAGLPVIFAALLYTLQIYTDFSGCVDICRGAARLFGIEIIDNFKQPYFALSIQDFWRRWHIALSSWLRDYVYISLGGNRKGVVRKYVNLLIVFFVSGLWHGVGVHYIVWGLLQGVFQIVGALTLPVREKFCNLLRLDRESAVYVWFRRLITLVLVCLSWIVFRANGTVAAGQMILSVFRPTVGQIFPGIDLLDVAILLAGVLLILVVSYYRERNISVSEKISSCVLPVRWGVYLALFLIVLIFGIYGPGYSDSAFIYMNF